MPKKTEANNNEGEFLGGNLISKRDFRVEVPGGHMETKGVNRCYNCQTDARPNTNPVPDHFPGNWTLPR